MPGMVSVAPSRVSSATVSTMFMTSATEAIIPKKP